MTNDQFIFYNQRTADHIIHSSTATAINNDKYLAGPF